MTSYCHTCAQGRRRRAVRRKSGYRRGRRPSRPARPEHGRRLTKSGVGASRPSASADGGGGRGRRERASRSASFPTRGRVARRVPSGARAGGASQTRRRRDLSASGRPRVPGAHRAGRSLGGGLDGPGWGEVRSLGAASSRPRLRPSASGTASARSESQAASLAAGAAPRAGGRSEAGGMV